MRTFATRLPLLGGSRMSTPTLIRELIATGEILGGALLVIGVLLLVWRHAILWWQFSVFEGAAVTAIVAGWRLLLNKTSGFRMSIALQAAQALQLYTPGFVIAVVLGPLLGWHFTDLPGTSGPARGFFGFVSFSFNAIGVHGGTVNVYAVAAGTFLVAELRGPSAGGRDAGPEPETRRGSRNSPSVPPAL